MAAGKDVLCGGCEGGIVSEEESVGCDGFCEQWFHIKCANLSKKRFQTLCKNKGEKWFCKNCQQEYLNSSISTSQDRNSRNSRDEILSEVLRKLGTLDTIVVEQQKLRSSFEHSIASISEELKSVKLELTKISEVNENLATKVATLENKNNQMTNDLSKLKTENELLKQYTRMNNLEIHGIPVLKNEDVTEIVKNLGKVLQVQVNNSDIDCCHRLPASRPEMPPPLLVKFCSRGKKNEILYAKKSRKEHLKSVELGINAPSRPIYINEHLTEINKLLHKQARDLKKAGYKYVWTRDCKIYARQHESAKTHRIQTEEDVQRLTKLLGSPTHNSEK